MRFCFFVFAIAAWFAGGCYRIATDQTEDAVESPRCGDVVLEGYLVTPYDCMSQWVGPSIPEYETEEGLRCFLNIRLSEAAVDPLDSDICSTEPVTSECFLREIGYIEQPGDAVPDARVTMQGYHETVTLCAPEGNSKSDMAERCDSGEIFIPCRVVTN